MLVPSPGVVDGSIARGVDGEAVLGSAGVVGELARARESRAWAASWVWRALTAAVT